MSVDRQPTPAASTAAPLPDNRYELGEQVAQGAFFTTYRGRDTRTGRPVAIKILRPEYGAETAFQERLVREANAARALQHPGIAPVYEAWRERGTVVIVTEFVRGINLKERIQRVAPFPLRVAIDITIAVAEALAYAASAGYGHGDLRPENIIVTPEGHVKLTDFGVGVALAESARIQMSALPRSAYYLSPEVAQGRAPDSHSDTYALGIILFEMLAGSVPYQGDSPLAVAAKHLHDPPPSLRRRDPSVPVAVDGICLKAMQKMPAERYANPGAMLADLRAVREALIYRRSLNWSPMPAPPPAPAPAPAARAAPPSAGPVAPVPPPRYFSRAPAVVDEDEGPSWKLLAMGLVGIFAVIVFAFVFAQFILRPVPERQIPSVVDKPVAEAISVLQQEKFKPRTEEQWNDRFAERTVYSQDPGPGSVAKEGSEVTLYVSKGSRPIPVPGVEGIPLRRAQSRLRDARLTTGEIIEEFSETVPKSEVIMQNPPAGLEVAPATRVDLTVSKGPEPIEEPSDVELNAVAPGERPPVPPEEPTGDLPTQEFDVHLREVPHEFQNTVFGDSVLVRITVTDEDGTEHEEYRNVHSPGDEVRARVSGRGHKGKITFRVYVDEQLYNEQRR
ncbi:MAG: protein kinase [Armatimonadetes bacterium]|nr:protein kinase [Armatimonadota bacterium]